VSEWSYQVNALKRSLPIYPTQVTFDFISQLQVNPGDFTAWWESAGGSLAIAFPGTFSWVSGRFQSSGYTGPVSVLYGSMSLSPAAAAELFSGASGILVLENEGQPVQVGLPLYTLEQDLSVSFSGSDMGVSGPVSDVRYQDPPATVSEPNYGWIFAIFGVFFCSTAGVSKRISRRSIQSIAALHSLFAIRTGS
jgi:hypothetical protein